MYTFKIKGTVPALSHTLLTRSHSPSLQAIVLKRHKTSHGESYVCVCVCEDECMPEVPVSFQHVLISANSSSEAPQLWWADGRLSGKERTHANIQTQTLKQLWMPSGFRRPPRRGRGPQRDVQNEWVVGEGQGRGKGAKEEFECVELQNDRSPPARYLLLIGHQAVDAVPTQ